MGLLYFVEGVGSSSCYGLDIGPLLVEPPPSRNGLPLSLLFRWTKHLSAKNGRSLMHAHCRRGVPRLYCIYRSRGPGAVTSSPLLFSPCCLRHPLKHVPPASLLSGDHITQVIASSLKEKDGPVLTSINMLLGSLRSNPHALTVRICPLFTLLYLSLCTHQTLAAPSIVDGRADNPLHIDWSPAPSPEDGPPISADALRNPAYLPAQIGGIVGAYAVSLVLVAITLLALSKKRRQHLEATDEDIEFEDQKINPAYLYRSDVVSDPFSQASAVPNFSYPSPTKSEFAAHIPYVHHSPSSSVSGPGIDPFVDQRIVAADRAMAQEQLEEMYKYVMEHEDAKQKGVILETPVPRKDYQPSISERSTRTTLSKKEKVKPSNLNLSLGGDEDKTQSRTSSILSVLRSPKKRPVKGFSISSPIMTPQSGTFPRHEYQEMGPISPRHYVPPPPPPPVPAVTALPPLSVMARTPGAPITPDISPESVQSIDERLGAQTMPYDHYRNFSQAPTEADPESATTEHSQVPLVGLPQSPKRDGRFPRLPASPKPGATFQRPNPPSAVRTGGALPLRAYEPALSSPSAIAHTTKQTVFERKGPLSPTSGRTPGTAAVPYSPYQPFTPCMPVTPSLVTKEDRKRMRRVMPKTPTLEMVRSSEDIW